MFKFVPAILGLTMAASDDGKLAALVRGAEATPDFEGFGLLLEQNDMWDESRWNNAVKNWDSARSRWRGNFAQIDHPHERG